TSIQPSARTNIGGVENLANSRRPSTRPNAAVRASVGRFLHHRSTAAVAKMIKAAMQSVVASEECATRAGENTNRARARFAAAEENIRRAVFHMSRPRISPQTRIMERARTAIAWGSGEKSLILPSGPSRGSALIKYSELANSGRAHHSRASGGWSFQS